MMIWFKHRHAMLQEAKRANDLRSDLNFEVSRIGMQVVEVLTSYQYTQAASNLTDLIDLLLEKERANAAAGGTT